MSSAQALVVLSPEQLAAIVKTAVTEAFTEQRQDVAPALLDRNGIAQALGCSPSQIDRLRRSGMPHVRLGDVPRFELAHCLEWLRQQGPSNTTDV